MKKTSVTSGGRKPVSDDSISVIANEHTNSLVVTANNASHKLLTKLIKQLDVRRPQVLIEAYVCEFTSSDLLNIGVEIMALDSEKGGAVTSFGLSSLVDEAGKPFNASDPKNVAGRVVPPSLGLSAFQLKGNNNIPILINALQSVNDVEIISVPRILMDEGEVGEIRVQQEEPVVTTNTIPSDNPTIIESFKEFVAAGTSLKIKPQIIRQNWLRLEIDQKIEAFLGNAPAPGVPPPKSSRSLTTVVAVPSGKTIILGGLINRREVTTVDKIPFLGDIPLLGLLFQNESSTIIKTNLYIFLTPKNFNQS